MINYAKVAANLRAAKALIDTPEKWTKNEYARDAKGRALADFEWEVNSPACFCSIGALAKAGYKDIAEAEKSTAIKLLDEAVAEVTGRELLPCIIADYNDNHTHEEVMAVWDKAIAKADELAKAE